MLEIQPRLPKFLPDFNGLISMGYFNGSELPKWGLASGLNVASGDPFCGVAWVWGLKARINAANFQMVQQT